MDTLSILVAGFSIVTAALLLFTYIWLIDFPNKSLYSILTCLVLLSALACIQAFQLFFFMGGTEPLEIPLYRLALFVVPPTFYLFGRWVLLPTERLRPAMVLHLFPITLLFVARLEIALPILFMFGAGYSLWLGNLVYGLKAQRKQFRFEFFYFGLMSATAVIVLILGFSIPYIDHAYFYHFYCHAIGIAFAVIVVGMIAKPDLIIDMTEAARVRYGASTLRDVDTDTLVKKLETLMIESKLYQNEALSLRTVADEMGLTTHQLSELVNTRLGVGFSRYVRERRVAAAKEILIAAPSQSILSISMDTGFKSQSSFYAAFKEVTGLSPGDYRKLHQKKPAAVALKS
jgi:AraC-like DNA-binding protein